ncbi:histidine kinase [Bacteroidota bacterium]
MKTLPGLIFKLLLLLIAINGFSQNNSQSAVICGKIIFEKESLFSLKPYSIILQKEWPITFKKYEQIEIDTNDFRFKVRFDLNQITYGNIFINFFQDIDSSEMERSRYWGISNKIPDSLYNSGIAIMRLSPGLKFIVEPGDSVNIVVNYNKWNQFGRASVSISGVGGTNNNLLRSRDFIQTFNKSFKLPLEEGFLDEDMKMKSKLQNIIEAKDSISPGYFNILKTDILFENLNTKHALIRASLYGSDTGIDKKRAIARKYYSFLDTLKLSSEYLDSREFRSFLDFYLEYLNRIITGKDVPFGFNERSYWLAKAVFDDPIMKTFLHTSLAYQLEVPFNNKEKTFQYEDFIQRFPNTPESYRLRRVYEKHFPVSNGQLAPDLALADSTGRKKDLSDLRGKVVILSSAQSLLFTLHNDQKLERFEALRRKFGDDLIIVALDMEYVESFSFSDYVDYYIENEFDLEQLNPYIFQSGIQYNFIIGKDGVIRDCLGHLYNTEKIISELILQKYTLLTRMKNYAESHKNELIILLSILISLTLIFLILSRIRQRRQELIGRHLNSELKALRSQLNPHFLFNSLNSIQNFINKSDAKAANLHLTKFAQLMRRIVELSEKESTTLMEELDFNKTYIELEQLRYGFKFNLDINKSIDQYSTEIPSMIIQPFVENAIVHCMAELGEKGELSIFVDTEGDGKIYIRIEDNGKGFPSDSNKGFGLKSSRERIDLLNSQNKEKIDLFIESPSEIQARNGTTVKLIIPKKY